MPEGKGTYGSQIGRPPKKLKKKYQDGGVVEPNFPMENSAIEDANKMGQELKSIPLETIPTSDARLRNNVSPINGEVGTGIYKEGGEVE